MFIPEKFSTGIEIAILDGRICYVGRSAKHTRGGATEMLDASGCYISPGFIDAHTHIGHYARPFENLQSFLPRGTTAVVASCDEMATVFGYRGLELFLDEVERHPLRVYTLVSMAAPQDPLLVQYGDVYRCRDRRRHWPIRECSEWARSCRGCACIAVRRRNSRSRGRLRSAAVRSSTVTRPARAIRNCAPLPRWAFPLVMSRFASKTRLERLASRLLDHVARGLAAPRSGSDVADR